jgi:hypothetical protein
MSDPIVINNIVNIYVVCIVHGSIHMCGLSTFTLYQRGLNTKIPTIVFFLVPPKPLPPYAIGDTVLVKTHLYTLIRIER